VKEVRRALRRALLSWYRKTRRDLPWRRTRDPYQIWVSETMLQQTRVETVVHYYERFLARFPDLHALATADTDDVLGEWAGLGYYGRARNLQTAARQVVEEWGGEMPNDVEGLSSLKGVGRYTAGAVASIAFDRPAPVVDGNVARVLTRLLGIREEVRSAPVVRRLWEEAEALARGRSPGDLNQALMELGATICTPRSPLCEACPIAAHCRARESGDPEAIPVKRPRPKPKRLEAAAAFLERRGKALAVRRPPRGLLGGLWELPGGELRAREKPEEGLARSMRERVGLTLSGTEKLGTVRHVFTHRVLHLHVYRARGAAGRVRLAGFDAHRWLPPARLTELPQSALMGKALRLVSGP
jgi:A/G-specific adenine glycosylase